MTVIAIIGAGSVVFTRTVVSDLLQQETTRDCEIRLCDIDSDALKAAQDLVRAMREEATALGSRSEVYNRDRVRFELMKHVG